MTRLEKIASLYIAITGDATPTAEELDAYAGLADTTTLEFISTKMGIDSGASAVYAALPEADVVDQLFINLFGYTADEITALKATEAGAEGFAYWVDQLVNNSTLINENTIAIALLNGAGETDTASALAIATDLASDYEDYTPVDPVVPSVPGSDFFLTSNTDAGYAGATGIDTTGTANDDSYYAYIQQNGGGVSNSLSSADHIDGGAGTDSLYAEISNEYLGEGSGGIAMTDIQPRTVDVEVVEIEARDSDNAVNNVDIAVTVDAKYMYGIDSIGSKNSDGDLVIENLNTLMDDKSTIRNTADITITMDHTDNFNSDGDASDLTVYFDEDYLVSGEETAGASLVIRMLNAVQNEADNNPVEGFSAITFNVGETEVTVDVTSVATDATLDYTTAYDAIVDLINAQLVADGFADVTAATAPIENAVFSIPVAGFTTGDSAGQYYPIVLTNAGAELLTGVDIDTAALSYDTDLNNSFNASAAVTTDVDLSVNVELTKVGNDGEGGNLIIGGKDQNASGDLDVDQTDGIDVFNITVMGDEDKPSNLGYIMSTDGALDTVNVASETRTDDSYAALTVTGELNTASPFGGTLTTFDADEFMGDLYIGQEVSASDINTFTAMGGGDVSLWATNTAVANSVDTGAGADKLTIVDAGSLDVNSGAGADTLNLTVNGGTNVVLAGSGDDELTIAGTTATVDMGAGADVVNNNSVALDVSGGLGNDVIYAQNTGTKALLSIGTAALYTASTPANDTTNATHVAAGSNISFLAGREVQVTISTDGVAAGLLTNGYETSEAVTITASQGTLTTLADLNAAVVEAINEDAVLSKIAVASVDANNNVAVQYIVDGTQVAASVTLEITDPVAATSVSTTMLNEYRDLVNDSTYTSANALLLLNGLYAGTTASTDTVVATDLTITAGANTGNTISIVIGDDTVTYTGTGADATDTIAAVAALTAAGYTNSVAAGVISIDTTETVTFTDAGDVLPAAAAATVAVNTSATGLLGTDSTNAGIDSNIVNGNEGDDLIVLGSDNATTDTVVYTNYNQGEDTIVHFESGIDQLNFTAYLTGTVDAGATGGSGSSSSESEVALTNTAVATDTFTANSVNVIDFNALDGVTATQTFEALTEAQLTAALNADTSANSVASTNGIYQSSAKSVLIIADGINAGGGVPGDLENEGTYKAYEVSYADATVGAGTAGTYTVELIGQFDLGDDMLVAATDIAL